MNKTMKAAINKGLLQYFKQDIAENNLPIIIEEGESFRDPNDDILIEVLITAADEDTINDTLNKCINQYFGLTE